MLTTDENSNKSLVPRPFYTSRFSSLAVQYAITVSDHKLKCRRPGNEATTVLHAQILPEGVLNGTGQSYHMDFDRCLKRLFQTVGARANTLGLLLANTCIVQEPSATLKVRQYRRTIRLSASILTLPGLGPTLPVLNQIFSCTALPLVQYEHTQWQSVHANTG